MRLPIVAVVAPRQALSEPARGLLRRCGFGVTEHRSIEETMAAFHHGPAPDYVVLMLIDDHDEGTPPIAPATIRLLLDAIQPTLALSRLVAVCPSRLRGSAQAIADAETRGVQIFPAEGFSVRKLARFLMAMRGVDGTQCCQSASERPREAGTKP